MAEIVEMDEPPAMALRNKKVLCALLFQAISETLLEFARTHLGGTLGLIAVLHTWDQTLRDHFHLHCLIPAGALSFNRSRWIPARSNFLFSVEALILSSAASSSTCSITPSREGNSSSQAKPLLWPIRTLSLDCSSPSAKRNGSSTLKNHSPLPTKFSTTWDAILIESRFPTIASSRSKTAKLLSPTGIEKMGINSSP